MKSKTVSFKLLMLLLFFPVNVLFSQDSLIISEFMAINNKTLQDEDSTYSDWIEIFNGGSLPLNLNGWCLSDDATNFSKWPFPAITIDPNEYLVIFASGKNRTSEKDKLHTNFKLSGSGEFLALSNPGASLYNSVFTPAYPEQYDNISYIFYNGSYIYSSNPTPGTVNDSGIFVTPPNFSMQHDFYDAPFKLALYSEQEEADIYYTTDASTPGISNGILYSDSIEITNTTVIRAVSVIDTTASVSTTSSYLFLQDVFNQFEDQPGYPATWLQPENQNVKMIYIEIPAHYHMNADVLAMEAVNSNLIASIKSLPIVSVVTDIDNLFSKSTHADSGGIYIYSGEPFRPTSSLIYHLGRGWERPASVEYFNSNKQDGSLDFQENCGLKIHGGASRSTHKTLKRSFKIGFKAKYGPPKLKEKVFGDDAPEQFDRLILRGGFAPRIWNNEAIDPWVKSAMLDMGQYAARSKFVHLFLNGMYWGMYNLSEQLDENFMRDNLGGSADDYDILKDYYEVEAGDSLAWDQLIALADDPANYQVLLGNHPDGTPDPSNEKLLNPENLIDYIIDMMYNDMGDWDHHNWVAARKKTNSDGFHFFAWDVESGLSEGNRISWIMSGGNDNRPSGLFYDLMNNQEFRDLFISRVNKSFFEDGALTPEPCLNRYKFWLDQLDTALIADQARWYANENDIWRINQHAFIYDYFPGRTETVFNQFIEAGIYPSIEMPEFNSDNSYIPANFKLSMTGPEAAEILYTVDGTDPGYFSLATSNSIIVYQDSIPLPKEGETLTIYARTKLDTLWSALVKRTFTIGDEPLISIDNSITAENYLYCYPNPMKDYTNIKYSLSEPSYVTLKVYNAIGEYITTLENGEKQQGEHIVIWNSGNYSSGIYFCIFDNYNNTKRYRIKMIKNSYE
jgi:hypothetical protein